MKNQEKQLLELFSRLQAADQDTLLALAECLAKRAPQATSELAEPTLLPRPEGETVIAAIRRLSTSYSMLDRAQMLGETSGLLSQHVLQGRPAAQVIDDLEAAFRRHYERLKQDRAVAQDGDKAS